MAKYSAKLVERLVALIEEDNYTIGGICRMLGIARANYYRWLDEKPEFVAAVNMAMDQRDEKIRLMARRAMERKLEGYRQVETKVKYGLDNETGELVVKEYVVKEKYCEPDTSAMVYALSDKNGDKKNIGVSSTNKTMSIVVDATKVERDLERLNVSVNRQREPEIVEGGRALELQSEKVQEKDLSVTVPKHKDRLTSGNQSKVVSDEINGMACDATPPGYRSRTLKTNSLKYKA